MLVESQSHIALFALKDIAAGTELKYDYGGDRAYALA
jgi:SET domain-containing protein